MAISSSGPTHGRHVIGRAVEIAASLASYATISLYFDFRFDVVTEWHPVRFEMTTVLPGRWRRPVGYLGGPGRLVAQKGLYCVLKIEIGSWFPADLKLFSTQVDGTND